MSEPSARGEAVDGVVQLRLSDETGSLHTLNAGEFAEVLYGLNEFTRQMAEAGLFGDGPPPEVRVRPPQEGSVLIEAVLEFFNRDNLELTANALTAGGAVAAAINVAVKKLRGTQVGNFENLENGNVKLNWQDGTVDEVPVAVWGELRKEKRKTKKALRRLLTPLGDDVTRLEVRGGEAQQGTQELLDAEPDATIDRDDYRIVYQPDDEVDDAVEVFDVEAQLASIDFRPGEKWRIQTAQETRLAVVADQEFLRSLDGGVALHKNDLFDVTIEQTSVTTNGRTRREWVATKVVRKRRGGDDDDGNTPSEPSPA